MATGTGTYFNRSPDKLTEVTGAQLKNVRVVRGDVAAGTDEVAVWDSFNSTVDTADQGVITATQERIALDRVTAQSVQCCGENPRHQGLTLKFPFDTKQTTYQFWDGPAQRPCRRPSPDRDDRGRRRLPVRAAHRPPRRR